MEKRNLQLLFDRPAEPSFMLKGNAGVAFDVPAEFLTPRFQTLGTTLTNRFGEEASERVPVTTIPPVDLRGIEELRRDEAFSIFIPRHTQIAAALTEIFLKCPNTNNLQSTALFCRDRVNPALFNYCLSVAILHRPDTKDVPVPTLLQSFPDRFIDSSVFQQAREEASLVNPEQRTPIIIPRDYTASDLDEEHRVAYWREDIGLNIHHWHWHLVYPFEGRREIVAKDRRGELFYYMHEQILARYNYERLSNMLARVKPYNNFREPVKEGYFSKLDTIIASRGWAPRQENMMIRDLNRTADGIVMTVNDFETYIRRVLDAIHTGNVMLPNGQTMTLDEERGIDILGDLIEATSLSVNRSYYGNFHNFGHLFLGYLHDPDGRYLERFGVMADPATDLRDPIFFRLHAYVDAIFQQFKGSLPRYTPARLGNPNITITDVTVVPQTGNQNVMETFWMQSDIDLSRGLDFVRGGGVFVRYSHLNHTPFRYRISYNNTGPAKRGTVRIFMAPKNDERGIPFQLREQRLMYIELDRFTAELRPGSNVIERRSDESSTTIPFERTFRNLEVGRDGTDTEAFNFCGCGWPQYLLIPKGTVAGMPSHLFVMISNYDQDRIDQDVNVPCSDASSYCGIRDRLYPDRRSMGYPFDRAPQDNIGTIEDFIMPNMFLREVTIRHNDRTILNPRNATN